MNRRKLLWLAGAAVSLLALISVLAGASRAANSPPFSGYQWTDSNAPDPRATFDWVEISNDGTVAPAICDDCFANVSLPFTFKFFGTDYSEIVISSNGFLSFNTVDPSGCNSKWNWGAY